MQENLEKLKIVLENVISGQIQLDYLHIIASSEKKQH